jgi:hypothetical protein
VASYHKYPDSLPRQVFLQVVFFPVFIAMFCVHLSPPLWCRSSLEWLIIEITLRKLMLSLFGLFYWYFCLQFVFDYSNRFSLSLGIVQASLFLHEFFLYILLQCDLKIYTTFQIYAVIFSLMPFGIDGMQ